MEETVKSLEPIIGEFKPKRKFLNFISAVNGARIRFIRNEAFIKGSKLSGILDNTNFKITICDEGTINFEEIGSSLSDKAMRGRLLSEIDDMKVVGYAQKFVIQDLEFTDENGDRCYLEVENEKPIDKLKGIMNNTPKISKKGLSALESLFGNFDEEENEENEIIVEEKSIKNETSSYIEESFKKMNEAKILELEYKIEEKEKEVIRSKNDITNSENKIEKSQKDIELLKSRLKSLKTKKVKNGFLYNVSEEQKFDIELDDKTVEIANKIADLMKLKKDVLLDYLKEGFYLIKFKNDENLDLSKLNSIDVMGKFTLEETSKTEKTIKYVGELKWKELVDGLEELGFEKDEDLLKFEKDEQI